ncbi:mitochondrial and cytoplasmic valyl-tRNA synthetase [Terfezia boudieri ATCC MYA-4762]|uniref:Valine--tRNA ligase, mitochondrial n=1 Tax=Terfezia boudieri ATCC MYA-4762 TaxID=1051890 RepID=A0A3N4M2K1_9PEZI|nr:mitochondrial and cytoplasmic valyl-tRNA synthetase [Terfezia boudieri ATCC MYA-4762]
MTESPPPVSAETKAAIQDEVRKDQVGDVNRIPAVVEGEALKVKTEKELEKERKKAEKEAKFAAKKAKQQVDKAAGGAVPGDAGKKKEKKAKEPEPVVEEFVDETKPGEKKILKSLDDLAYKAYNPTAVESSWYSWWEKEGFFEPEFGPDGNPKPEGLFVIPAPPPNVTGALHIGHALTIAIQDTMIRWNRMLGKTVLFVPGFDHAGISTQSVVEKMLWKKERKTRHDLGREKFTELVWEWKEEYHMRIKNQLKKMGASYDWSREAFTMDEARSKAVIEAFVRLHEDGIIYRENRLVNWCCKMNTTLSNLEVDQVQLEGRTMLSVPDYDEKVEFGAITSFAYPIEGTVEKIIVATTRPETMLGDTAIAVHPDDERYTKFHGRAAIHPFIPGRKLPIVLDTYVEKEFGTGAVKITPAHDQNDYEIGKRHNLEFINILNDDGTFNNNVGPEFAGMKRFTARKVVVERLKQLGLYVETKDNPMNVPLCSKSKDVIEPLMKPQWWVKQKALADAGIAAVRNGEIKIQPSVSEKDFYRWLENIQDWCISRQLWWGHRAPAYYVHIEGESHADGSKWVVGRTEDEARAKAEVKFPGKKYILEQDPDVLDTWFSSGLWPFSTLGWPDESNDMSTLFPMSILETGWDILFFWVARMVMLGIKLTGKVPFTEVFCHSLVRDSEGRKMSKSLGNVIDPLDIIAGTTLQVLHDKLLLGNLDTKEVEMATRYQKTAFPEGIPQCGSDAMHFAFCAYTTGGRDINMDIKVVHGYRKFCNKIYQATKFALMRLGEDFVPRENGNKTGKESLVEMWILHKYTKAAEAINKALEERDFSGATSVVYNYWYAELCDVYIENSKPLILEGTPEQKRSAQDTLYTCLEGALTMIHPFMPFVTEELWQRLPRRPRDKNPTIVKAAYPKYSPELDNPAAAAAYDLVFAVVRAIRSLASEYNVKENINVFVQGFDDLTYTTIQEQIPSIIALTKGLNDLQVLSAKEDHPEGCALNSISKDCNVYLLVKGRVDVDSEISKALAKLSKADEACARQEKLISAADYKKKVKQSIQEADAKKIADLKAEAETLRQVIAKFEGLRA